MTMVRLLIALLVINSFPAPALAQVARVAGPVRMSITVPALSVSPSALSGMTPSLSAPSLGAPLGAAPAPALAVLPLPSALLPLMPAAATPAKPEIQPERALAVAKTAAASAAQLSVQPGSLEFDRARVDFVDGAPSRTDAVEAPESADAPARLSPSSLTSARRAPAPPAPRLAPFLGGTFLAQVASNALQVTMPLLILQVTGSAATAAFSAVLSSVFDAAGTFVGGRLTDRFGSKRVLVGTTLVRGAAVLALPLLAAAGLTLPAVLGVYMVESLARGVADTARHTLPSELAGKDEGLLKKVLSKNQSYFEAGGIAGPFLAGALIAGAGGAAAAGSLWLAPVAFAGVTLAYLGLSKTDRATRAAAPRAPADTPKAKRDGWMKWALGATALLTLYPLKGVLPAIFAANILNDPASAAWLVGLFGVGGLIGSVLYGRLSDRASLRTWLSVGAVGTVALSVAFLPASFIPAALGVLIFGAANVAARLSLNAAIQSRAPEGKAGAAVGSARFTANLTSLSVRFLAGLAFAAALAPAASFWLIGGGVLAAAGAQIWTARRLEAPRRQAKSNIFDKDPAADAENIRRNYLHEKRGAHFYFRNMLLPMQTRFAELMDMASTPRALLHGSPHIDNYAKSGKGAAMVDFDRSRVGPYTWDLVRLMVSLSLRRKKDTKGLLDKDVLKRLKKGYLRGFRHPDRPFSEVRELKDIEPEADELSTNAYLKANKKWAKEMRRNALPADDDAIVTLVNGWAAGRGDGILNDYYIEEAGRGQGSMGFRGLFLVVLAPKDKKAGLDRILLNIKATRTDPDTEWYKSPYGSEAERMRAAAELYAPGWELRAGGAVLDGVEYYARQLDPLNAKLKKMLNADLQEDFAYAVGTQLGRAHRLSLDGATPAELEDHLESNFEAIAAAGLTIRDELVDAHARYLSKMKAAGLTPPDEGEEN